MMNQFRIRPGVNRGMEIVTESGDLVDILGTGHQGVAIFPVLAGQGADQVANIGPDAEIANATDVDDDMKHRPPRFNGWRRPRVSRRRGGTGRSARRLCGALRPARPRSRCDRARARSAARLRAFPPPESRAWLPPGCRSACRSG